MGTSPFFFSCLSHSSYHPVCAPGGPQPGLSILLCFLPSTLPSSLPSLLLFTSSSFSLYSSGKSMSWSYRAHATPASGTGTTSALPTCSTCNRSAALAGGCPLCLSLSLSLLPRAPPGASRFCQPNSPLSCPWTEPPAGLAARLAQNLASSATAFPLYPLILLSTRSVLAQAWK